MTDQSEKTCENFAKHQDTEKPPSRKSNRKGGNHVRIAPLDEFGNSNTWMCKNSACKAILSMANAFCKRCSCCICHSFDDNKDPSLWLVCSSDAGGDDHYCGQSCHIECALKHEKVGVVNSGQLMELDGSYCCFACGKLSSILGCWKKQLLLAKKARRVDSLCERVFLSFRLLDGTSRFKDLHKIVEDAKARLESEVGPLNEESAKNSRGFVSRLSVGPEVLGLCSLALEKADEWLTTVSNSHPFLRDGSLPAACKFFFEEVTGYSIVIVLLEMSSSSTDDIQGYKLWYCKSRDESYSEDPISVFPRFQRRILISNLQPCTEYSFKVRSYNETGDLGHSEAKCFTQSSELIQKKLGLISARLKNGNPHIVDSINNKDIGSSFGFKIRNLGRALHLAWAQEEGCNERSSEIDVEKINECEDAAQPAHDAVQLGQGAVQPVEPHKDQSAPLPRDFNLNVASVQPVQDVVKLGQGAVQPVEPHKNQFAPLPRDFDLNVASVQPGQDVVKLGQGAVQPVEPHKDQSAPLPRDFDLNVASVHPAQDAVQLAQDAVQLAQYAVQPAEDAVQPVEPHKDQSAPLPRDFDLNVASVQPAQNAVQHVQYAVQPDEPHKDQSAPLPPVFDLNVASVHLAQDAVQPAQDAVQPVEPHKDQSVPLPRDFYLNVASVPDLNEELFPQFESQRNEKEFARSHGCGYSQGWVNGEVPAGNHRGETCGKRAASSIGEAVDCNRTLVNGSISEGAAFLDENLDDCVMTIKRLKIGSCSESQGNPTT